ncbi:MAG: hypothetical protein DRO39_06950 [Thermoprotei archaeon]|nr:MAG: hypothetical protein DRO39_06950 [Thermoprotei archaeon]
MSDRWLRVAIKIMKDCRDNLGELCYLLDHRSRQVVEELLWNLDSAIRELSWRLVAVEKNEAGTLDLTYEYAVRDEEE